MSAANRGAASDPRDYYPSPEWVAELYARWLASVTEVRSVCDPFAGDGAILRAFRRVLGPGVRLVAMERDPALAAQITVADEVIVGDTFGSDRSFDFIITNPPYTRAREAVHWCRDHCRYGAALLLNSTWIGRRYSMELTRTIDMPFQQHVLPRPSFVRSYQCKTGCGHRWQTPPSVRDRECPECGAAKPYSCTSNNCEYSWFSWLHAGCGDLSGRYSYLAKPGGEV